MSLTRDMRGDTQSVSVMTGTTPATLMSSFSREKVEFFAHLPFLLFSIAMKYFYLLLLISIWNLTSTKETFHSFPTNQSLPTREYGEDFNKLIPENLEL